MDLFEVEETGRLRREEAAARLRELADALARNNELAFDRDGRRVTVRVPDEVELSVEFELGADGGELEIEISWSPGKTADQPE
jgi:amphi-Trp domain-containing protein